MSWRRCRIGSSPILAARWCVKGHDQVLSTDDESQCASKSLKQKKKLSVTLTRLVTSGLKALKNLLI